MRRLKLHKHIISVTSLSLSKFPNFPQAGGYYTVADVCQVPAQNWQGVIGRSKFNQFTFRIIMTAQRRPCRTAHICAQKATVATSPVIHPTAAHNAQANHTSAAQEVFPILFIYSVGKVFGVTILHQSRSASSKIKRSF